MPERARQLHYYLSPENKERESVPSEFASTPTPEQPLVSANHAKA